MRYLILVCVLLIPILATGQHNHSTSEMKPVVLAAGLGEVNHPVSTNNREAQQFFNQGLAYIYAFNHEEAVRSFRRAAQLDPQLAMAYWGIALALGSNYNLQADAPQLKEAYANLQRAIELATKATEHERHYIEALSKRYSNDPQADLKKLASDYKFAMGNLVKSYPDDMDAATLYAESLMNLRPWKLWTPDGKPAEGTEEIINTLEGVLRRDPNHTGANHYYIHAVEASPTPERGLASAARLTRLAPAAGHLVHMPSHIYIRTGDYEDAAKSNADAIVADRAYIERSGARGVYPMMYYNHNIHFLASSHAMNGRYGDAIKSARELEASVKPHVKAMPMLEMFMPYVTVTEVRFRRWNEILNSPEPDRELKITTAFWHFARGLALASSPQITKAESELAALRDKIKSIATDAPLGNSTAHAVLKVAEQLLAGQIALARGDRQSAIELMRGALEAEDSVSYNEPPDWDLPVREWLGATLLVSDDSAEAEKVFRAELRKHLRNGRALFGLAESLKRQGKTSAALMVEREFDKAWLKADTKLSVEHLCGAQVHSSLSKQSPDDALRFDYLQLKSGVRLRYAEQGESEGEPVIFLHGYTDSWFSFSRIFPLIGEGYHIYALDLRGHGGSDRPERGYRLSDFARDVLEFMNAKRLKRVTLVGHSMGSFIAQCIALRAPDRIARLVLIGSGTTTRTEAAMGFASEVRALKDPVSVKFARDFQDSTIYRPLPGEFVEQVVQESLKLPARVWRSALKGILRRDYKSELSKIKIPTLIIWGDRDAYFPRSEQQSLVAAIRTAVLKVYTETGHAPHWERPEQFVQDLKQFIGQTDQQ